MKMKKTVIVFGVFLGLCILYIYCYELSCKKTFTLVNGDMLIMRRESSWEVSIPYCYQIKRENKTIIPESAFFYQSPEDESPIFELVYSDDKKMVAIVTKKNPKTIFILHNLETNESAPYQEDKEDYTDYYPRREKMLNEFNNNNYEYQFWNN